MRRGLALLRWGLVPNWANDPVKGVKPINARAESVAYKFGEQFRGNRCLIPADGFYEWATVGGKKRANHFTRSQRDEFVRRRQVCHLKYSYKLDHIRARDVFSPRCCG